MKGIDEIVKCLERVESIHKPNPMLYQLPSEYRTEAIQCFTPMTKQADGKQRKGYDLEKEAIAIEEYCNIHKEKRICSKNHRWSTPMVNSGNEKSKGVNFCCPFMSQCPHCNMFCCNCDVGKSCDITPTP